MDHIITWRKGAERRTQVEGGKRVRQSEEKHAAKIKEVRRHVDKKARIKMTNEKATRGTTATKRGMPERQRKLDVAHWVNSKPKKNAEHGKNAAEQE